MQEIKGDIWELAKGEVIVITTNGMVKTTRATSCDRNLQEAIMGKGIALQAKQKYPILPNLLGECLLRFGNQLYQFSTITDDYKSVITFPTKEDWKDKSLIELIVKSTKELVQVVNYHSTYNKVYLPQVGCGNGRLNWKTVKATIEPLLDDRFIVCSLG